MTHNPHRAALARSVLGIAATSSSHRNERVRQSTAPDSAKRVVHTTLIDAGWDLEPDTHFAHQAETRQLQTLPPRTSIIDAEWDSQPSTHVAHRSGEHRIDALAPRTSIIDSEWDSPPMSRVVEQPAPRAHARRRLLALVDADDELDPVITYFELDGPECLGLLEGELD
jgi:hypothetical protein